MTRYRLSVIWRGIYCSLIYPAYTNHFKERFKRDKLIFRDIPIETGIEKEMTREEAIQIVSLRAAEYVYGHWLKNDENASLTQW